MTKAKIAVTLDEKTPSEVEQMVNHRVSPSRSSIIEQAIQEKLARISRNRLSRECAKLDTEFEKALAEEGLG